MKAIITVIALSGCLLPAGAQQREITARVCYARDSIPVEFATVRLMQNDSVMAASSLTDSLGRFSIVSPAIRGAYLDISALGCERRRVALPCDSVICIESANALGEVVVRGSRKYVSPTARGLNISMAGNPAGRLGSALDALKQLPMIDASGGGIMVLGHGSPVIYINSREVRDPGELATLAAGDIARVEIITNPSSKYGADVTSVIIIHTRKLNAGFHSAAAGNVSASEEWSASGDISLNYHTESGVTVFGDFSGDTSGFRQERHYEEQFYSRATPGLMHTTDTRATAQSRSLGVRADGGVNYDFGRNSAGAKYTFARTPRSRYEGEAVSTAGANHGDEICSRSSLLRQSHRHHLNMFGNFALPGGVGLRIDADYVGTGNKSSSDVRETGDQVNVVSNTNESGGSLWAGKIVASKKAGRVELEAGTDLSYTRSRQESAGSATGDPEFLKPETDCVSQSLYAGYAGFDWYPSSKWNIYGGVRVGATATDFYQNGERREDLSKSYADLLPNAGIAFISPLRLTLYYRASVARPGYNSLDNTYLYVTPTLWETGNPELRSTLRHRTGLNISYRKFTLQSTLTVTSRGSAYVYYHDEPLQINVVQPVNLPRYRSLQFVAVQQLDFSFWHPVIQGVFYAQDLEYGTPERKYRRPLYTLALNNRFDIPGGIYAYLNIYRLGTGNQDVLYSNGTWQASVTLNKSWKNLTFTLTANDIFDTWRQRFDTLTNTVDYSSEIHGASRSLSLSIRYALNSAKGKYKGKPSRQDEIDRL